MAEDRQACEEGKIIGIPLIEGFKGYIQSKATLASRQMEI